MRSRPTASDSGTSTSTPEKKPFQSRFLPNHQAQTQTKKEETETSSEEETSEDESEDETEVKKPTSVSGTSRSDYGQSSARSSQAPASSESRRPNLSSMGRSFDVDTDSSRYGGSGVRSRPSAYADDTDHRYGSSNHG